MMKHFAFFVVVVLAFIPQGYGLKCYSCEPPNSCTPPAQVTCTFPYDRCFTTRLPITSSMTMEIRNCTMASMCTEAFKVKSCQGNPNCSYSCCEGDLCNDGSNPSGSGITPSAPASNKSLTCYECSTEGMGPNGTGTPLISCSAPKQRKCGELYPGMPFDRCMTVKMTAKNPATGALLEQEMRNCSSSTMMCSSKNMCRSANTTGDLIKCNVQCCEDNLCNAPPSQSTVGPSPSGPVGGQTPLVVSGILVLISIVMALFFK